MLEASPETNGAVSLAGHKLQLVSEKLALAEQQIREFIDVSTQNQTLFQLCHQLVQQTAKTAVDSGRNGSTGRNLEGNPRHPRLPFVHSSRDQAEP